MQLVRPWTQPEKGPGLSLLDAWGLGSKKWNGFAQVTAGRNAALILKPDTTVGAIASIPVPIATPSTTIPREEQGHIAMEASAHSNKQVLKSEKASEQQGLLNRIHW